MLNSYYPTRTSALLGVAVLSLAFSSQAQTGSVDDRLQRCAQQSSDAARLACFDELAASVMVKSIPVEPASAAETAPAVVASTDAATMQVDPSTGAPVQTADATPEVKKTETFGTAEETKQSIRVMVEKTKRNARGDWYFYFDNGEVWKQIDTRNRRIPPLPVAATVSRGIFSSHKLHIDGEVWSMKIRRIK